MQYKFTKDVEIDFDKISDQKLEYKTMLSDFWEKTLKKDLENA